MASKKFKLFLIGVFALLSSSTFAQQGGTYDVYDSSVISSKGRAQANEFWNNTYNFPAKPRNMWELGISAGMFTISGDVPSRMPTPGFSVHIQKALGYTFAIRAQYMYGIAKGLNWNPAQNYAKNAAWSKYNAPVRSQNGQIVGSLGRNTFDRVFYNYRTQLQDLNLEGILTLNNIRFHKQKTGIVIYTGAGFNAIAYKVKVNALDANNQPYTAFFNTVASQNNITHANRHNILKQLKAGMDDTYETDAAAQGNRRAKLGGNTLRFGGTFLAGIAFKLGKRINLALEEKYTVTKDDLLDGQQWQEHAFGDAALTPDFDSYNYASLGLNFNIGAKAVEPLWWLNPLDYAYSELNNPRHMKLPKPILDDTDGDGVIDQLDKEPNTPAGCPVDTHGVSRDTDGDGVPDCKDKQLITPTECQPVDADGVGKCPPPACCADLEGKMKSGSVATAGCSIGDLPSLSFKGNTTSISSDAKAMLATVASKMKGSAECGITITGYPNASKASQSVCQKRLAAIKQYLMEKESISGDRITTNCEPSGASSGDEHTVDIKSNTK